LAAEQENPRVPQVDVIVSEWMGYFLLFENMIGSYTLAIQKFLKPEGIMIPQQSTMYLNAAAYNLEANKVAKIYLSSERCKLVKIEQCKPEYLV
jgi:predicted RNA methylase